MNIYEIVILILLVWNCVLSFFVVLFLAMHKINVKMWEEHINEIGDDK